MTAESKNLLRARGIIGLRKSQLAMAERLESGELDSKRFAKLASESTGGVKAKFEQASDAALELERAALSASERIEFEALKADAIRQLADGEKLLAERQAAIAEQAETLKTLSADYHAAKSGGVPTGGGGGILNAYNGIRDPEARAAFYAQHKEAIRRELHR